MISIIFINYSETDPNCPRLKTLSLVYVSFLPGTTAELAAFDYYHVRRFQKVCFCTIDKNCHQTCAKTGVGCEN